MITLLVFLFAFVGMEFMAWFLHKYVMHGPLWFLHADHHDPHHQGVFQKNDAFAFFFFAPSFLSILFGSLYQSGPLQGFGYGIMAYGAAYFIVHEVIIHRRLKWFKSRGFYLNALVVAHKKHHYVHGKHGATNFGMLAIPPDYFKKARKNRKAARSENQKVPGDQCI